MIKRFMRKTAKRLFAAFLIFSFIGGMLPGLDFTLTAHAEEAASGNWSDHISEPALTDTTYTIASAENLAWVASQVNSGITFIGYTLNVTQDIDLSDHYWVPIGSSSANSFQGTVQGNNKEISGLTIGSAASPDTFYTYTGLFGYIKNATINNVALRNATIYCSNSTYIGGIAGYMTNTISISGCSVTGYFYNSGTVAAVMGGLLGYKNSTGILTVVNSWSQCIIYSNNLGHTGGLVGYILSVGSIKNCFAAGKIFGNKISGTRYVGGLAGYIESVDIYNSFSNCIVSAGTAYAGGIAGYNGQDTDYSNVYAAGSAAGSSAGTGMFMGYAYMGTLTNCFWNTTATPGTGKAIGSGIIGSGSATGMTQANMTNESFSTTLNDNADALQASDSSIKDWVWDSGQNGEFPRLSGVGDFSAALAPTVINPVVSGTAKVDETLMLSYTFLDVNDHAESGSAIQWYRSDNSDGSGAVPIPGADDVIYTLTDDDASKYIYATVTPSNGTILGAPVSSGLTARVEGGPVYFDNGSGTELDPYQIITLDDLNNVAMSPDSYYLLMNDITGLDSVICTGGASVFNGHFDGGGNTVTLAVDADSGQYTGMFGVVGSAGNIHDLNIAGSVSGPQIIGGIAALNQGTISNCDSSAAVLASGSVSAKVRAGGIAGENTGTITGCSVTGTMGADSLTGTNSLTAAFGGIAGRNSSAIGLITDCHADMTSFSVAATTFGAVLAGGIVGLNEYAHATITNCYTENDLSCSLDSDDINSRVLVGGIAGDNDRGSITGCFATGDVTGSGECGIFAGGLAGQCSGSFDSPETIVLSDSYYWGTVSGNGYVGGLTGYLFCATLSYCYSAGSVSGGSGYAGGLVGYNASGNTEYCYSNSYGTAAGGRNGGLYGGRSDIPGAGAVGSFWNRDNTSATYGDDANHLYPIGTPLPAVEMTGSNASVNMPELDFTTHFVIKDSTPTERYFPQLAIFANSSDNAIRAASLGSVTMAYTVPSITTQPGNQTVTAGETAEFTVAAAGSAPLAYQWKKDGSSLSDGGKISGAATASLTITNTQKIDEGSYTCYVSNASGGLDSDTATLTVNLIAPSIITPPSAQTVTEGGTASFTVTAAGTGPLSYQWKKDGSSLTDGGKISGATTAALTITNVQKADEGSYTCYISNAAGNVTSDGATLTVNLTSVKPTITWQPEDKTASAGWIIDFSLVAQGTAPLSYQWQKDGVDLTAGDKISGSTTEDLVIGNVQESDEGIYSCIVSNAAGSTTSNAVTLTVDPIKPSIVTQPANQTRTVGDDVSFTVLAAGSEPFIYQWRKNGIALADGGTISGVAAATLTISSIQEADAGNYSCYISNDAGNETSSAALLTVNLAHEAPTITVQPEDQTVPAGQAAVFTVVASGNTPITYQWRKNGVDLENGGCISGAISPELRIGSLQTSDAGIYTCLASNDYGSELSNEAELIVGAVSHLPPTITTTSLQNGTVGTEYSQTLAATGETPILWMISSGSLPDGLTLSPLTGIIIGTPMEVGTFYFTVRAENSNGDDTQGLSITINNVLTIDTPSLAAAAVGSLYSQTVAVTYTGSDALTFSAAGLPSGLTIGSSTGEINGTPDTGSNTSSPYSVEVTVTDGTLTDTETYLLTVNAAPTYTASVSPTSKTFTAATAGYSQQAAQVFTIENTGSGTITGLSAVLGGTDFEISEALSAGSLNAGGTATVSIRPKTGLSANTYTDTLNITGNNGVSLTASLSFTVNAAIVNASISPTSVSYDIYMPDDVSTNIIWNSAGTVTDVVYGTTSLTTLDAYVVTGSVLTIKNDYLSTLGLSEGETAEFDIFFDVGSSAMLTVNIVYNYTPSGNADLSDLKVNGITLSGFDPNDTEYNVKLPYGTLPGSATSLVSATADDPLAQVSITQSSTLPGSATVAVTAENGTQKTYTINFTLGAAQGIVPEITTTTLPGGMVGTAYSETLAATGDEPITWTMDDGDLPDGLLFSEKGVISGTPTTAGTFNFTVKVENASGDDTKALSIVISAAASADKTLVSIVTPFGITGVANGTAKTAAALGLPSTVMLVTNDGNVSASVSWDVASSSYDPSDTTEQTFTVDGIVTLPSGVVNPNSVSLDTSINVTVKARSGGSTDGGSSDGSSTPSTPTQTYNAVVSMDGTTSTTLPVNIDTDTYSATVNVGTQQGDALADGRNVVIDLPSIPNVNNNTLGIPVDYLSGTTSDGSLTLNTNAGSMTLPSNMLTGVPGMSGSKAEITKGQGDKENLPDEVKAAIGDRPLIQLTLSIDGKQTNWSNPNAAVTVSIPYTPTAEELLNPESIVIWYIDGSGNVVTIPNGHYDPATGTVTVDVTHFSDYAVAYNPVSFSDVADGAWYNKAVSFIAARGITDGTGNGKYSPEAKLTRGEFIVLMMRAYGIAPDTNATDNFADAGNTYYTGYLAVAKRLGISAGVGNNLYAPGKEITRQEMFTLLYNALKVIGQLLQGSSGKALSDFTDAGQIDSWAKEAMSLLVETGTVGGNGGKLTPTSTTTRAEMAQLLYNLLGK